eukprot:scaffold68381_cov33-Phaeocystis_antarctica.AAC.1
MRALGHKGQLLYAPEASSQAAGAAAEPVDRATLEAWARGEAAPAKPTPGEAAAEAAEAAAEDARGADLAMEGEVSFEAEEDDRDGEVLPPTSEMESGENQTEVAAAAPLVITPTDAELLYGNSSLRIARPDGYWNQVTAPTELASASAPAAAAAVDGAAVTDLYRGADVQHGHFIATDGTVVHGSSSPVVDRYNAAQ